MGVEHAEAVARPDWELTPRYHLAAARVATHDLSGGIADYDRVASIPNSLNNWSAVVIRATCAIADGRLEEADALIEEGHGIARAPGDTNDAIHCIHHVALDIRRGRFDDAARWAEQGETTSWGPVMPWRILVQAEAGDHAAAAAAEEQFASERQSLATFVIVEQLAHAQARIAFRVGGRERAARLRPFVAPYEGKMMGDVVFLETGDHALGGLAFAAGEHDEAVALLERGLAQVEALGLRALVAEHQVDLASALLARGAPGDSDRAKGLLTDSGEAASLLGLVTVARDIKDLS